MNGELMMKVTDISVTEENLLVQFILAAKCNNLAILSLPHVNLCFVDPIVAYRTVW